MHRRAVSPQLSDSFLRPHLNDFHDIIEETMASLPSDGKPFDFLKQMTVCKTKMFMQAALGDMLDPEVRQTYQKGFSR